MLLMQASSKFSLNFFCDVQKLREQKEREEEEKEKAAAAKREAEYQVCEVMLCKLCAFYRFCCDNFYARFITKQTLSS